MANNVINTLGQIKLGWRDGNLRVPYVFVPPTIFDTFATTPMLGYSLRKLRTAYSGNAIRVRRSYDNAESDIGFANNGILDTAALQSFVNAGKTLGDQDIANWDSISYATQSIVTDSLIFHVDAANTSSYSGSGTTLNSLVGTFSGTMTGVSFEQSNGGTLGFNNSYVTYGSKIFPSEPTNFSLSAWVYINSLPTGHQQFLSWWASSWTGGSLFFGITSGGGIRFGEHTLYGLSDQHVGRWVEITIVKEGTLLSAYINGSLLTSTTAFFTFKLQSNLTMGTHAGENFSGRLAQVKIYNKALSFSEVYQNYRATCGTFNQDHDALSFINTAGLTQSLHKNAVHRLVRDLKNNKLWTKLRVVYPFVGGTQLSHSINLKDPRDLDAARRIRFYGGWTHSSTGAQPNGTNGWGNTYYNASTDSINIAESHISYYSRTNTDNTGIEIGVQGSSLVLWYLQLKNANYTYVGDNNSYNRGHGSFFYSTPSSSGSGNFFYQNSMSGTSRYSWIYKNGVYLWNQNMANNWSYDAKINNNVYIGSLNNGTTASNFSNKEVSFATIGDSMDEIEIFKFNLIVQKFQTYLGRQIGTSYSTPNHIDDDIDIFINNAQITDSTQQNVIEKLVKSFKYEGIWHTALATYPFIGATATSHRFNLNSYKYTLTFGGGWTHTSTGAKPNGTNAYAHTGIVPSTLFSANTGYVGFYTRTDINTNGGGYANVVSDIMSSNNAGNYFGMQSRLNGRLCGHINGGTHWSSSIDPKESTGFNFVIRGSIAGSASTRLYLMKNDTIDYVDSAVEGISAYSLPSNAIALGCSLNEVYGYGMYSPREHSLSIIGNKDMTQLKAQKLSRIVQRYQTDLNRNATITDLPYSNSNNDAFVKVWYDQSISGKNLVMNTNVSQPQIYSNGSLITDVNGKAALQFDGWNDAMFTTMSINFQNTGAIITVQSGTAAGIYTRSNIATIESTTIGTYLPSAYTWTSNGRHNNQRMPIRAFCDNTYQSSGFNFPYWAWTTGSTPGGRFGGYYPTGMSLVKDSGVNISSFYLNGSTVQFSNNFLTDTGSTNYDQGQTTAGSLLIGGNIWSGGQEMCKMKYQEILVFDKSYSIANKLSQEKNMYDFYTPFTYNSVSDTDSNNLSLYLRLTSTQSTALNNLASSMKSTISGTGSLWDKMVAIYPIVGGNAQGHSFNLKDISYSSEAWTLFHSGGITHDSTGMLYNGSNGTSIIYKALSDNFATNNFHMSFYLNGGTIANSGLNTFIYQGGNNISTGLVGNTTYKGYNNVSISDTSTNGYFIGTSITQNKLFRNGTLLGTASLSATMSNGFKGQNYYGSGGWPRITIASNFNVADYKNVKTGFMTIGYGLTDTDVTNLNSLVLTYQTALGR